MRTDAEEIAQYVKKHYAKVPAAEERELIRAAKAGCQESTDRLVKSMALYCVRFARARSKKYRYIPFADSFQDAQVAVLKAIDHFDLSRPIRLITLVHRCLRTHLMQTHGEYWPHFRLPSCTVTAYKAYRKTGKADLKALAVERIADLNRVNNHAGLPVYDPEFDEDPDRARLTVIDLLSMLGERDRKIVKAYYGIDSERQDSVQIAKWSGLGASSVRSIASDAVRKFRVTLGATAIPA